MKLLILFVLIIIYFVTNYKKIEYFKLEYNPNDLTKYIDINLDDKMSFKDFNTEKIDYYKYPFKCKEYSDIKINY